MADGLGPHVSDDGADEVGDHEHEVPEDVPQPIDDCVGAEAGGEGGTDATPVLGMGPAITSKLLARKRPRLVPVYDSVVKCAFGNLERWWRWLDGRFAENGGALHGRLSDLRDDNGVDPAVTPLRVLDVIVWMSHRRPQDQARGCAGLQWARCTDHGRW